MPPEKDPASAFAALKPTYALPPPERRAAPQSDAAVAKDNASWQDLAYHVVMEDVVPNYRRDRTPGGSYFFTLVTHQRQPWLCRPEARAALRHAVRQVRASWPFRIEAWVLLPDHLHCIWTLPEGDADFSTRWRLVKRHVGRVLAGARGISGRDKQRPLWQNRFWEHRLRDERDFGAHCAYIHYNPVKHGLCGCPQDWPWSTIHRFIRTGLYPHGWGGAGPPAPEPETARE